MANETGIEVASTNLLLKLGLRQDDWIKRTFDEEEYTCQVAQKYVESKGVAPDDRKATDGVLDPSIYYLKDPKFEDVLTRAEVHLGDLDPHQV
ncbi:hypothetical protein COL940_014238 [Colletotrichum noveboracense]|nr:hypothetical protein COL940_014238 [Colletotrichum noveboracense]